MNSPQNQERFSASMRPIVEEYGMLYIDNYPATYDAVFQNTPHAIKFAKNSAFHYLNAGRCGRSVCGRGGGARSARARRGWGRPRRPSLPTLCLAPLAPQVPDGAAGAACA